MLLFIVIITKLVMVLHLLNIVLITQKINIAPQKIFLTCSDYNIWFYATLALSGWWQWIQLIILTTII